MKRILCLSIILLMSVGAIGLAQRSFTQGRMTGNLPVLSLYTPKADFARGEQVQFNLRVTQSPLSLQGSYYTIEKMVGPNSWTEFYRSAQNPLEQMFMTPNTEQSFTWGQINTAGIRAADAGTWRVKLFLPAGAGNPVIVNFNILQGAAGNSGGQEAALTIKCMRNKLLLGEKVTFRLENVSGSQADLTDCYYVIQRLKNNRWLDWLSSGTNPFNFRVMNPGDVYKWDWNQTDGRGHRTERGDWRIVFYAPRVAGTPVSHIFYIR